MSSYENDPSLQENLVFDARMVSLGLGSADPMAGESVMAREYLRQNLPLKLPEGVLFRTQPTKTCQALTVYVDMATGDTHHKIIHSTTKLTLQEVLEPETIQRNEENVPLFFGDTLDRDAELPDRFVVISACKYIWVGCSPYINSTEVVF